MGVEVGREGKSLLKIHAIREMELEQHDEKKYRLLVMGHQH